jgi:hypothetical protein
LGTTLVNHNSNHEEIRADCNQGMHAVIWHRILSSTLLSKDSDIRNYNFACCFVSMWNLVSHTEGGIYAEDVQE